MKPLTEKEERDLRATLDMWENMEEEQRLMQLRFMLEQEKQIQAQEFEKMILEFKQWVNEFVVGNKAIIEEIDKLLKEVRGEGK